MTSVQNPNIASLKVVDRMLLLPHHKIFLHEVLSLLRCLFIAYSQVLMSQHTTDQTCNYKQVY